MKVAIVHDWLVSQRGGENVLAAICELFPTADLFTLVYKPGSVSKSISKHKIYTSALQKVPSATRVYRHFLPIMPKLIESFDLSAYDLVISSSHCVAKGVIKKKGAFHFSYVHAPMRYMWDRFNEYFGQGKYSPPVRMAARLLRPYLQKWDKKSATRVDAFASNSKFIAAKVKQYYGRDSQVIYPFCDFEVFQRPREVGDAYVIVTALVPYKRVDLAVETFNLSGKKLIIVGDGPELQRLKEMAKSNIQFLAPLSREDLAGLYSKGKALIFPGIEDFGIVPLESMAAGMPVIAYGVGGALETVTEKTGLFFTEPTVKSLTKAINQFESKVFDEEECRKRALLFSKKKFQTEVWSALEKNCPSKIWSSLGSAGIAPGSF